jgi:hypothetical protein
MNKSVQRIMLGLVGVFLAVCIALMSFGERRQGNTVYDSAIANTDDRIELARSLFRRGMIDAASNRFARARRAFDAARRAAKNDGALRERIDVEAAKLETVSRKGDVR